MDRLRIAGICLAAGVVLLAAGAAAAWYYRTSLVGWIVAAYLAGDDGAAVDLDVVAVERDHLLIRNIRIASARVSARRSSEDGGRATPAAGARVSARQSSEDGERVTTVRSLRADYSFDTLASGRLNTLSLVDLQIQGGALPVEVGLVQGSGRFGLRLFGLDRFSGGFDLVRMRIGPQRFDPSRVDIDLHEGSLEVDTALTSPDGYITVLGNGPLDKPDAAYRLQLSGRLNAALLAAPVADRVDAAGHVAFSLSAQMSDPLFFLADDESAAVLPEAITLDGDLRLALDRLRVGGVSIPMAEPDRLTFHAESKRTGRNRAQGSFTVGLDAAQRDTAQFGFAKADARIAGRYEIDGSALTLAFDDGPLVRLHEMRLSEGLPVPGDIALELRGGANTVTADLAGKTARHALESRLSWKAGELSLTTQGHLTDPEDPTTFTLSGAYDATPLFSIIPATKSVKGNANLFLAGRISEPLLMLAATRGPDEPWPGDIRLDGAVKLDTVGLHIPGSAPNPAAKDSLEIILKGYNGSSGHQSGRLAVNAVADPRKYGGTKVDLVKLALEGRISVGARGYQFLPGIESVLNIKSLQNDAGVVVPNGLNFQLTGGDNRITVATDLSEIYHELTFAHLEADGYVQSEKERRPFRVTVPKITSRRGDDGKLAMFLTDGSFELSADKVTGRSLNASLEETADAIDLRLEIGEIRHGARPPYTTPLAVNGTGTIKGDLLQATLTASQRYGPLKLDGTVKHNLKTEAGRLDFAVPRIDFGGKKDGLDDIFPLTAGLFTSAQGAVSAKGHMLWDKDLRSGEMAVALDKVGLVTEDVRLADLTGTVNFIELVPLAMPPRQRIRGTIASGELGPWPMQLEFQLLDNGKIDVQDLDITLAGGVLRSRAIIDPAALSSVDGSVQARSIDLEALLKLIGVDGLNGTGRITGTVPIQIRNGQIAVVDGLLKAEGPGSLRYTGTALQEQLSARNDTVGTVAQVLSDFYYKKLDIELDKEADGKGAIVLHMDGANPKILDGHPFAFNISIESDFNKLGKIAQGGLKAVTDVIRQTDRPSAHE
jgi:hypothetical protein